MHGVGNVITEVHYLCFDATLAVRCALAHPVKDINIIGIEPKLGTAGGINHGLLFWPWILRAGIQAGAGEIQAKAAPVGSKNFGLEASDQTKSLSITFKSSDVLRPRTQSFLTIVTKGRVADVMGKTRSVNNIWIKT